MHSSLTQAQWLDRFHSRLGELLPSLSAAEAFRCGQETYLDAHDLAPEEAAEIYAMELPPSEVGAPGD